LKGKSMPPKVAPPKATRDSAPPRPDGFFLEMAGSPVSKGSKSAASSRSNSKDRNPGSKPSSTTNATRTRRSNTPGRASLPPQDPPNEESKPRRQSKPAPPDAPHTPVEEVLAHHKHPAPKRNLRHSFQPDPEEPTGDFNDEELRTILDDADSRYLAVAK